MNCIDRAAAAKIICAWCGTCSNPTEEDLLNCDDICPEFAQIPAADVRPVVRGKWEELPPACNGAILTRCSACKRILTDSELGMVKTFCPNCGADMREKEET